jgi:hypothetical protein
MALKIGRRTWRNVKTVGDTPRCPVCGDEHNKLYPWFVDHIIPDADWFNQTPTRIPHSERKSYKCYTCKSFFDADLNCIAYKGSAYVPLREQR